MPGEKKKKEEKKKKKENLNKGFFQLWRRQPKNVIVI